MDKINMYHIIVYMYIVSIRTIINQVPPSFGGFSCCQYANRDALFDEP